MSGVLPKTIRYYIAQGLLDRPKGTSRSAYYTREHLACLQKIKNMRQWGVPLDFIRVGFGVPDAETSIDTKAAASASKLNHFPLDEGVGLIIDPAKANLNKRQTKKLRHAMQKTYRDITNKENFHD